NTVGVITVPAAERHSRHERGPDKPLAIDDIVIAALAHGAPEARHLPPRRWIKRLPPPAAGCDRNNLGHGRVKLNERCERLLHHPEESPARPMAPGLGE